MTTNMSTVFQLTAEDLSNLGGAMGSETTTYRPVGLYAMKEMAKVAAQRHYNDRAGRNPKVLEWRETIGGVSSKDMGFVMYHIREREILS